MTPILSLILPTYNESQTISKLIKNIHKVCKNISHEIIVVDDQSPDGTLTHIGQSIRKAPWLKCFSHPGPRDLGGSILYGLKRASGRICIGMDADGNHDPAVIPTLLENLTHADIVVASRFLPGGGMQSGLRYHASRVFNTAIRYILGFPVTDSTSGFYAIRKKALQKLPLGRIYYGYGEYHLRLVWFARKANLHIDEIPVYYGARLGGTSKSRLVHMLISYSAAAIALWRSRN